MKPQLIIHIGAAKAGSSAIQGYLRLNYKLLEHRGIVVPGPDLQRGSEVTGEHIWLMEQLRADPTEGANAIMRRLARLQAERKNKETRAYIISAENLSNSMQHEFLFTKLTDLFVIKVVIYIRRQDEFLCSSWQQWGLKRNGDFWSWLLNNIGTKANWELVINPWAELYGKENVFVRIFESQRLKEGSLISDFCSICDIQMDGLQPQVGMLNPSYNLAIQEMAHEARVLFDGIHDNEFYQMVSDLTGDRYHKNDQESFLSVAQRNAILSHYEASNQIVKAEYFSELGLDENLFSTVRPNHRIVNQFDINMQKHTIHTDLLFNLYMRLKKLER